MKFFVILSALTTLASASLFGGKIINLKDDGSLIVDTGFGKQLMITKPMGIWAGKLGQITPNMLGVEDLSVLDRLPWWVGKDSTSWRQMTLHRTPMMMNTIWQRSPSMFEMDGTLGINQMPLWLGKDSINQMTNQVSPMMMQTMQRSPMMRMWMKPTMIDASITPMMHSDMTPMDIDTIRLMRLNQGLPLMDTRMITNDPTTRNNFWNMYMNNLNTPQHQMNVRRLIDDTVLL